MSTALVKSLEATPPADLETERKFLAIALVVNQDRPVATNVADSVVDRKRYFA